MTLSPRLLAAPFAALMLSACAGGSGDYPSLAIRDVERQYGRFLITEGTAPAPAPAPAPVAPVAGQAAIAALVSDARASFERFEAREDAVARLVGAGRGRSIDSDARAAALTALSDLSAIRSATAVPLGDLDLLAAEAATTFAPTDDIDAARALVLALVERQDAVLAELWAEMDR
ncbi:hypothetical protein [Erythrobacter sp.]|uniref:hypothetical protein n=1 Tax=Erythrobacter sp. TaxID=1042 RepID=UPI001425F06D|nr:hypothetical protein [Erythrobacter sp.]QIQ86653.1 MAG: hypothetical protein G9473_08105 [Erythrobacter sp.]